MKKRFNTIDGQTLTTTKKFENKERVNDCLTSSLIKKYGNILRTKQN